MGRVTGKKLVLREFWREDYDAIRAWMVDERTTGMLGGAYLRPQTREDTESYLDNLLAGGSGANFVIADKGTLEYLGQASLLMVDHIARKAEMAMLVGEAHAGRGVGYEAGRLLLGYAFDQMNLNKVYLRVCENNARAIRLYEKLGFRREGVLREEGYLSGRYEDVLAMGLLRREWDEIRGE